MLNKNCIHYWSVNTIEGGDVVGLCQRCGEEKVFRNIKDEKASPFSYPQPYHISGDRSGIRHFMIFGGEIVNPSFENAVKILENTR